MNPAADRADRQLQDLGDRVVLLLFHVFEDQHGSVFRGEPAESATHATLLLRLFERVLGPIEFRGIQRLCAWVLIVAAAVDPKGNTLLALERHRRIDRDPVQPGEKLRVPLESVQRLVSAEESLLDNVTGIFRIVHQAINRVVEPVLVTTD